MGAVDTTYTFTATDTITSTKMNDIIDQTTMTGNAIIGTTLEVVLPAGKLKVRAAGITSNELAANSVTTNAITDLNVTTGKIADLAISTGKISDLGVTTGKIANDAVTTIKVLDANITATKLDGAQTGSAPIYGVRAWVNFDASRDASGASNTSNTNRFIRSSGNVTSVLKTATGKFTVTFTVAMPNTNYIVTSTVGSSGLPRFSCADRATATTTSIRIETDNLSGSPTDLVENNVMVIA